MLTWLAEEGIATALVTRNSRLSAETVTARYALKIGRIITREDGPFKPSPISAGPGLRAARDKCDQTWMVGDGQYDVEAALAANIRAVWISHAKPRTFDAEPWLTVANLAELAAVLKRGSEVLQCENKCNFCHR